MFCYCKRLFIAVLCLLSPLLNYGQKTGIQSLVANIDSFSMRMPAEKVYLHFDKPYYITNDTIWIKAYVLDADLSYSKQSGLLYVELVDDTNKVVIRQSLPVKLGISFGQMILDSKTVPRGSYTIRAYTSWMQNMGEQCFFTRQLYINNAGDNQLLVSSVAKPVTKDGKDNIEMSLLFNTTDKNPARLRNLQLKVMNGEKVLNRDNMQTDMDGKLNFNFGLPAKVSAKGIHIVAEEKGKDVSNTKLDIPVTINRPQNTDLQFMPEGGQLVAGLYTYVAFKAIGEDGKGADVSGTIVNGHDVITATFKSKHNGMGIFEFTPELNENYTAKLIAADGKVIKNYPLPQVKPSGINIHILNHPDRDTIRLIVSVSRGITNGTANAYSVIGQSGGKICYAASLNLIADFVNSWIPKAWFPTGIARFTIFNADDVPVAERIVFIDHHDGLHISINPAAQAYHPKDSIAIHLQVTDKDNKPVLGSFSVAITDDGQVKADSSNVPNLYTYMLMAGDLKGAIEDPGYYFDDKNADRYEALDNLLLTQGWISYSWKDIFDVHYQPQFKPGQANEVTGQISRVGSKHIAGLPVVLLSIKKPVLAMDTVSDANGRFVFKNLPPMDTANFIIEVKDKKGHFFEANVVADEFTPSPVTLLNSGMIVPPYLNTNSTLQNNMQQANAYNKQLDKILNPDGRRQLKEVVIKAKKTVKGSHNLNGPGEADQVLDEKDIQKAGKMTLMDLLATRIKGFSPFKIHEKGVKFVFDGVQMDFYFNKYLENSPYDYYMRELSNFTAEDIKGIEVMYNVAYNSEYTITYNPEIAATANMGDWPAYIEITTWSGNGLFEKRALNRYLYRPLPVSWPKQFYHPKYTAASNNTLADLRPTVYWEPNIITDKNGMANLWFYAKSKAANYTIIAQGSDLIGSVGVERVGVSVK